MMIGNIIPINPCKNWKMFKQKKILAIAVDLFIKVIIKELNSNFII